MMLTEIKCCTQKKGANQMELNSNSKPQTIKIKILKEKTT